MNGWIHLAWMLHCLPERRAFRHATRHVAATQGEVLQRTLRTNRDTWYGRRFGFSSIRGPAEFQRRVPLVTYEDLEPAVERIGRGESRVLTAERVRLLEPTSGTTRGEKLIPYTRSLSRQFQRAVAAWVGDLLWCRPALRKGRAYWSISPALGPPRRSPAGIPIGFEDDASYLSGWQQWAVRRLLVTPAGVRHLADIEMFQYATLLSLLRADDLTLISVWNPTFLTQLLAPLARWQEPLIRDVRRGTFTPPDKTDRHQTTGNLRREPASRNSRPAPRRADDLARVFRESQEPSKRCGQLWPGLQLISCWTDAAAARGVPSVRELFPSVEIQGKGLLATEGCVSFPQCDLPAPALALRSGFFEFETACDDGSEPSRPECRFAWQLEPGARYRVVVTTAGGLFRYRLRDEVRVEGFLNECPLLRFLGKSNRVSDLVGEKLAEPHVRRAIDRACESARVHPRFALLVPIAERPPRYRLYAQSPGGVPLAEQLGLLEAQLQAELEENPHYRYAVRLGQLAAAEVRWLPTAGPDAWETYRRACTARGQKLGGIKPAALDAADDWPAWFEDARRILTSDRPR